MQQHTCGFEEEIYCRRCRIPLSYDKCRGLYCPKCRRPVTMICPKCGQRW